MGTAVRIFEWTTASAFLVLAAVAHRSWRRFRFRGDLMMAAAATCLGLVGLLGRAAEATGLRHQALTDVSALALLGSGLALVEARHVRFPLRASIRRLVPAIVAVLAAATVAVGLPPTASEPFAPAEAAVLVSMLVVWGLCALEPGILFWRMARRRPAIERGRLRLLATAHLGLVLILGIGVGSREPVGSGIRFSLQLFAAALVPILYAALAPPRWLRGRWIAGERSRERERLMLTLPAIVWTTDADMRITSAHGAGLAALGQEPNQYVGYRIGEFYDSAGLGDSAFARKAVDMHERVLAGGSVRYENAYDGIVLDNRIEPLWGPDGRVAGCVGLAIDMTERKRVEEALQRALDREREAGAHLRVADEMKNAFLTAVSHELRTPMTAVLGFAHTLGRGEDLPVELRRVVVSRLIAGAERLDRLLSDLLDLDRVARGIVAPRRRPTDVGELVRRVVEETALEGRHPVEVHAGPAECPVDGPRVERIVENLLVNAAKYTPPGTPIWVRVAREDDGVLIAVDDAGAGVPRELRRAVFEPFRRGSETASHAPGVGIGLSLVARFAALHGGRAWVEDRPGGGASFKVRLPDRGPELAGEHDAPAASDGAA